jgi:hypothetical protein
MTKTNKLINEDVVMNVLEKVQETEKTEEKPVIQKITVEEKHENKPQQDYILVKAKLKDVISIPFTLNSTSQNGNANTESDESVRLINGRTYYVSVDTDINSDNYAHLKILSDIADKIDIRYIKDGVCALVPIQHNIKIKHGQRLCYLWNPKN